MSVLDFGGNVGNILRDPTSSIDEERYWCLDVDRESIAKGKGAFPKAHWILYDRYCFFFNPLGSPTLAIPYLEQKFDYIVAYSVFTNTSRADMIDLEVQLEAMLAPGGVLAFTFIDPYHYSWPGEYEGSNLQWRLDLEVERRNVSSKESQSIVSRVRGANWFTLVNATDLYVETEHIGPYPAELQKTYHVFYTSEYMQKLFPHAEVLPPVNGEMQHCCVVRRALNVDSALG